MKTRTTGFSLPSAESCEYGRLQCRNSIDLVGEARGRCAFCRLSPESEHNSAVYWVPIGELKGLDKVHPLIAKQKREAAFQKNRVAQTKRLAKDRGKTKILRKAVRAEKATEENFIRATKNSGRSNRDGDHVAVGEITLDTKLQTNRENPVVLLAQLTKVRQDAKNGGNDIGALVLRNKYGVGVVAIHEDDFAKILVRIGQ